MELKTLGPVPANAATLSYRVRELRASCTEEPRLCVVFLPEAPEASFWLRVIRAEAGVPVIEPSRVSFNSSLPPADSCLTSPKSRTFTKSLSSPYSHTNRLAGLMSRWTKCWRWAS